MSVLTDLKPQAVFQFFETICSIPHGSGNVSALVDFCVDFAEKHGLSWYRDQADNLVIRKPGSPGYEHSDVIILQGHTDMVCEKELEVEFDFTKDSIQPVIDGDLIRAKGTTLGADNGIAVAMCLALLDDDTLEHPPLEILLTSDEEIGMVGAFAFDCANLSGHKLINLDSEYEGVLMCSCAGGANACSEIPVVRKLKTMLQVKLEINGLKSGHSGVEINKGRANSNVLMARLLSGLAEDVPYQLIHLNGGSRETAIASETTATIGIDAEDWEKATVTVAHFGDVFKGEYVAIEPNMTVICDNIGESLVSAVTVEDTKRVVQALLALPDGVQAMSADISNLVQTSTNFGILELRDRELYFVNTVRSSMGTQKMWILNQIKAITALAGGWTKITGNYPGWSYNPDSAVKNTILRVYRRLFQKEAVVDAVHAGIECGLFADGIKNLDCVSIGPEMADVHTPREHVSISSMQRTYQLLREILKESI